MNNKLISRVYIIYLIIGFLAAIYFIKTKLGVDIFPKRHMLFFKE